eukprot:COSAG01_NODE_19631_length_999_cov_2.005556_1_plen_134_part_00
MIQGLVHLVHDKFHKGFNNYEKHVGTDGEMKDGRKCSPFICKKINLNVTLARKYVVHKHLGGQVYKILSNRPGDPGQQVNLKAVDETDEATKEVTIGPNFTKLCCGLCETKRFPCPKVFAALEYAGGSKDPAV